MGLPLDEAFRKLDSGRLNVSATGVIDLDAREVWYKQFHFLIAMVIILLIIVIYSTYAHSIPDLSGIWQSNTEGEPTHEIYHNRLSGRLWVRPREGVYTQCNIQRGPVSIIYNDRKGEYKSYREKHKKLIWDDGSTWFKLG
jgi:hypothetical protein